MRKYTGDFVSSPENRLGTLISGPGVVTAEFNEVRRFEVIGNALSIFKVSYDDLNNIGVWQRHTNSMRVGIHHLPVNHVISMDTRTAYDAIYMLFFNAGRSEASTSVKFAHSDIIQVIGFAVTDRGGWVTVLRRMPEASESNRVFKFNITVTTATGFTRSMDPRVYSPNYYGTNSVSFNMEGRAGDSEVPE